MRDYMRCLITLFFIIGIGADAKAAPVELLNDCWIFEDPRGTLGYAEIMQAKVSEQFVKKQPLFGLTTSAHWLRFKIRNPTENYAVLWLDAGNRTLQELDLYYRAPNGVLQHQSAGSRFPYRQRPLQTDSFVFPLELSGGESIDVYLRVRSTTYQNVIMMPSLWQPDAFRDKEELARVYWIGYLGMATALGLFNLMLWLYLRDGNHLLYVLSLVSIVLGTTSGGGGIGSAYRMLWPESPHLEQAAWIMGIFLSSTLPFIFILRFVAMKSMLPKWYWLIVAMMGGSIASAGSLTAILLLQFPVDASLQQTIFLCGALFFNTNFLVVFSGLIYLAIKRNSAAYFVVVAYLPISVATVYASYCLYFGAAWPTVTIIMSAAFELLVMALALAFRVHQERHQKLAAERMLVKSLKQSEVELEQKVLQRTLELNVEQQRTKELLYNILPVELADELSATGRAQTARHESATVLFTDFTGFTAIAATMPADRMISELNEIFAAFDDITDACGVEKIKTIGDAYMAAAGLPKPCEDHAQRCVRAGLKMIAFIEERNRSSPFKWSLRVGIHSGPVVSGVVGKRKYAFDIWGDTVNIASRMESSGVGMRVNVSAYTSDLAKDEFECEYRGKVVAKGKGEIDMYFVKCTDKQPPAYTGTITL